VPRADSVAAISSGVRKSQLLLSGDSARSLVDKDILGRFSALAEAQWSFGSILPVSSPSLSLLCARLPVLVVVCVARWNPAACSSSFSIFASLSRCIHFSISGSWSSGRYIFSGIWSSSCEEARCKLLVLLSVYRLRRLSDSLVGRWWVGSEFRVDFGSR
jgi:hypothetical protein